MAKTKKPQSEIKWQCPVCGDIRYQKIAGIPVQGVYTDPEHEKFGQNKTILMGGYFSCRGCSVHFNSPTLFNKMRISDEI